MLRRSVDMVVALVLLFLAAPLMLVIAVAIQLDSPGAVLYTPRMVGHRGKVFTLLRFRTMAPTILYPRRGTAPLRPCTSELENIHLTRVGGFIRNISLDHLPMLFNLLRGDLTLVGPRPMEPERVDLRDSTWQEYFQEKPGVINYAILKLGKTWNLIREESPGLNQVLELDYRQVQSAKTDLGLVIETLRGLIISRGNVKARGIPESTMMDRMKRDIHSLPQQKRRNGVQGETVLVKLLKGMEPELHGGVFVFCTLEQALPSGLEPIGTFQEGEGLTVILPKAQAEGRNIPHTYECAWITLTVHSSLTAVGLTAAVAQALAEAGISCNVVAAYHHDHLFVPVGEAERAMEVLRKLSM